MPTISNNTLSIRVATKGAELQSIFHKSNELEYMWSGDPEYWGKFSPVLFPIVGELKNKKYRHLGTEYGLSRHGFAREQEFKLTDQNENAVTLCIHSNNDTLKIYPFDFIFFVRYTLMENTIRVSFIVENQGKEPMLFSVGAHPAFKVPLVAGTCFEDYQLVFDEKETIGRWPITTDGLIMQHTVPLLDNEKILPLKKELFATDAIVFKNLQSKSVSIRSNKTKLSVSMHFGEFPFLGIWETKGGDFICLEPWWGIADSVDASGNLQEKEGIITLAPAARFEVGYSIEIF